MALLCGFIYLALLLTARAHAIECCRIRHSQRTPRRWVAFLLSNLLLTVLLSLPALAVLRLDGPGASRLGLAVIVGGVSLLVVLKQAGRLHFLRDRHWPALSLVAAVMLGVYVLQLGLVGLLVLTGVSDRNETAAEGFARRPQTLVPVVGLLFAFHDETQPGTSEPEVVPEPPPQEAVPAPGETPPNTITAGATPPP